MRRRTKSIVIRPPSRRFAPCSPCPRSPSRPRRLSRTCRRGRCRFHHGKHHQAYVDKANAAIKDGPLADAADVDVVRTAKSQGNGGLFNNAAQAWNHSFLWNSLSPSGGGAPTGALKDAIDRDLGGMEKFAESFKAEAVGHFRERLGVARPRRPGAQDHQHPRRRYAAGPRWPDPAGDARPVGTCLLSRLPECSPGIRRCVPRAYDQLGVLRRRTSPRSGEPRRRAGTDPVLARRKTMRIAYPCRPRATCVPSGVPPSPREPATPRPSPARPPPGRSRRARPDRNRGRSSAS